MSRSTTVRVGGPRRPPREAGIDRRSAEILLAYAGGPTPAGVPARDLHGGDLARIAYVRALRGAEDARSVLVEPGAKPPATVLPDPPDQAALRAVLAELAAHPAFAPTDAARKLDAPDAPTTPPLEEAPDEPAQPEA